MSSELHSSMVCLHPSLSEGGTAAVVDCNNDLVMSNEEEVKADQTDTAVERVVVDVNTFSGDKRNTGDDHENFNNECCSISSDDSEVINYDNGDDVTVIPAPGNCAVASTSTANHYYSDAVNKFCVTDPKCLQQIVDNSVGLKKILFRNHFMEPISFLLLLHDFSLELRLTKVIEDCGGLVYSSVRDIDGFTAVLVKDDSLYWAYTGPAFKVSYISACIEAKKVLDIAPFFKSSVKKNFTKDFDYMNVIYFKKVGWDGISIKIEVVVPTKVYNKSINASRVDQIEIRDSDDDVPLNANESRDEAGAGMTKPKSVNKHSRKPYSREEDENIVKYIVKKKAYNSVKGDEFWKNVEKRDICPPRTWQSMKEHFRKQIIYKLDGFKFLTDKEKYDLQTTYM